MLTSKYDTGTFILLHKINVINGYLFQQISIPISYLSSFSNTHGVLSDNIRTNSVLRKKDWNNGFIHSNCVKSFVHSCTETILGVSKVGIGPRQYETVC